jgi:hypothetical protein
MTAAGVNIEILAAIAAALVVLVNRPIKKYLQIR